MLLSLEDIGLEVVTGSRQVQFGAAEGALDLRAHYRDRKMIISHLPHSWDGGLFTPIFIERTRQDRSLWAKDVASILIF